MEKDSFLYAKSLFKEKKPWLYVEFFNSIGSTSDYLKNKIKLEMRSRDYEEDFFNPLYCLIVAEQQTEGRGRGDHKWFSPPFSNLYFSVGVVLNKREIRELLPITLVTGVGVCEAINRQLNCREVNLKWPNDLIINGKKVGGILTEFLGFTKSKALFVIGVGINVNLDTIPEELKDKATSLFVEEKRVFDRVRLLYDIVDEMERVYGLFNKEGFNEYFKNKWLELSKSLGKIVKRDGDCGKVVGVSSSGGLLIEIEKGIVKELISGIISYEESK